MEAIIRFAVDDDASTAVEYAVMLALIIVVCIGAVAFLGTTSRDMWNGNSGSIGTSMSHVR